ncbi:putative TATA-binding protein-associated factor 172 [Blattamonas nauphoetae]|uniref:TATA-binding protein-associated factor 172 n=1 Tax=Blattamonas nauphoetae TaxID=2049346 RepID=A0ABQ9YEY1_9EUKA|nr:putative TATA-binding protein-associated factor 172 [Blattamonas nauphoetae]
MEIFRSIDGKLFDSAQKYWTFPLIQYNTVVNELCQRYFKVPKPNAGPANEFLKLIPRSVIKVFSPIAQAEEMSRLSGSKPLPLPGTAEDLVLDPEERALIQNIPENLYSALFEFQKEAVSFAIKRKGKVLIGDEMGLGKAQPYHSKILTPSGWKRMGTLRMGDKVVAMDGTTGMVNGLFEQGIKDVWTVRFNDGSSTECTDEHLWRVRQSNCGRTSLRRSAREVRKSALSWDVTELKVLREEMHSFRFEVPAPPVVQFSHPSHHPPETILDMIKSLKLLSSSKLPHSNTIRLLTHLLTSLFTASLSDRISFLGHFMKNAAKQKRIGKYTSMEYTVVSSHPGLSRLFSIIQDVVTSVGGLCFLFDPTTSKLAHSHYVSIQNINNNVTHQPQSFSAAIFHPCFSTLPPRFITSITPSTPTLCRCLSFTHPSHVYLTDCLIPTHNTLSSLSIACAYQQNWPLLVICPATLRLQWADEIEKWCQPILTKNQVTANPVHVVMSQKDTMRGGELAVVISYDLCVKMIKDIIRMRFGIVIADEAHYLKNSKTDRTKTILPVISGMNRVMLLTGTPAINRPAELYTLLRCLDSNMFWSKDEFHNRYCDPKMMGGYRDIRGASNLSELHLMLAETVMIRRLKKDVLTQLPEKRRIAIYLDIGDAKKRRKAEARMMEEAKAAISAQASTGQLGGDQDENIMRAYQNSGIDKLPAVKDYIKDQLEKQKFLVFAHHKVVMDGICEIFKTNDEYIRIDGDTPGETRQALVDYFQSTSTCKAAVLSINAASTGLTLTEASLVIFAELSWTPGQLIQAEDRVHRIGQFNPVCCVYLLAKGSIDEVMWGIIRKKLDVIGKTLNGSGIILDEKSETVKTKYAEEEKKGGLDLYFQPRTNTAPPQATPSITRASNDPPDDDWENDDEWQDDDEALEPPPPDPQPRVPILPQHQQPQINHLDTFVPPPKTVAPRPDITSDNIFDLSFGRTGKTSSRQHNTQPQSEVGSFRQDHEAEFISTALVVESDSDWDDSTENENEDSDGKEMHQSLGPIKSVKRDTPANWESDDNERNSPQITPSKFHDAFDDF